MTTVKEHFLPVCEYVSNPFDLVQGKKCYTLQVSYYKGSVCNYCYKFS